VAKPIEKAQVRLAEMRAARPEAGLAKWERMERMQMDIGFLGTGAIASAIV
jgi:hypothetical protein